MRSNEVIRVTWGPQSNSRCSSNKRPPGHRHMRSPRRPQGQEGRCQGDTENPGAQGSRNPAGGLGRVCLTASEGTHCRHPGPLAPRARRDGNAVFRAAPPSRQPPWGTSARPGPCRGLRGCCPGARAAGEAERVWARWSPPCGHGSRDSHTDGPSVSSAAVPLSMEPRGPPWWNDAARRPSAGQRHIPGGAIGRRAQETGLAHLTRQLGFQGCGSDRLSRERGAHA